MNSLLAIFGGSAAASGVETVKHVAAAATRPFAEVLSAIAGGDEQATEGEGDDAGLLERVADKLQEILAAAGLPAGDTAAVRYHEGSGEVHVDYGPAGAAAEAAIAADDELLADLGELAALDAADEDSLELLIEVA
jgi:hypothetical protein